MDDKNIQKRLTTCLQIMNDAAQGLRKAKTDEDVARANRQAAQTKFQQAKEQFEAALKESSDLHKDLLA